MAPATGDLVARQYGYGYGYGYGGDTACGIGQYYSNGACYYSSWYSWGRWVLFAGVVIAFGLLFCCCGGFSRRRRRQRGLPPRYGTGWIPAGPAPKYTPGDNPGAFTGPPPPQYSGPPQQQQQTVPQQQTGTTFNSNEGYYGRGNNIELQQPQAAYHSNTAVNEYEPPNGPPPKKTGY